MSYIPYAVMMIALASLWFSKTAAIAFAVLALASATFLTNFTAGWILFPLLGLTYLIQQNYRTSLTKTAHTAFTLLGFLLFFHMIPGFNNFKVFDGIQIAPQCKPFTMYMNLEGALIAFTLIASGIIPLAKRRNEWKSIIKEANFYGMLCTGTLMIAALLLGHVTFDVKFPSQTFIFLTTNLMLTCIAEEAFFRGYIQKGLTNLCQDKGFPSAYALIITSILFGFRHYQQGVPMIILSTIAGLFYGAAFLKTNRIESSILVHISLNATHFFFFSYPALLR
ncbi:MAG: CPBP family intramembrane metalloprotease [Candidatus Paracaedibacteraceae bacterium]|nr:CPBP family intramembrane metalloprotease [Candidatus Paracaedibacteraceae bacterium]